ncbi:MarR family winged helix-turn-helix transcriptional regulator [Paracoccus seriniphilus]|uniref:Transcriptional regulator, MarR family n=1 Tax=Paracoccus seriniphilus TaxID=184748 RepID=A0A239PTG3_9RHOB|nr:MarR family winged helix-turn-helix transcriptional regulator [Paracoccus seriniphilus]WCR16376.1 winged helix-turn-helix transcriptional regulator [Paracoccus seriniphilus]SNT73418.1 transcriptional regulator, MarR family [Paracoccus seriniphilus]
MNTKGSDAGNVPQDAESPFGKSKYDDLWGRPGYLVRRLHQIHIGLFAEACDGMDLTAVQYAMLSVLYSGEEFDQLSLSKAVGIDRTSGADVIKRLVRRGLATREPSEADRRAQVVRITEEGRVFVRQVRPLMEEAQDKFVSPLTKEERKVFMRLLSKLIKANNDASRAPMK